MANVLISQLFVFIGVALLGSGLFLYWRQRAWIRRARRTTGVVIELQRQRVEGEYIRTQTAGGTKLEGKYRFRPVVRFETHTGQAITFTANISLRPAPMVGTPVEVLYDPDDPRQAGIAQFIHLWFYVLMLIGFGLFAIGMGSLGLWLN